MSNIYHFPRKHITTDVDELIRKNQEAHEEIRAIEASQVDEVVMICQHELLTYFELQGIPTDSDEFIEHFSFAMESIRSCLMFTVGLKHPLQQVKPNLQKLLDDWPDS